MGDSRPRLSWGTAALGCRGGQPPPAVMGDSRPRLSGRILPGSVGGLCPTRRRRRARIQHHLYFSQLRSGRASATWLDLAKWCWRRPDATGVSFSVDRCRDGVLSGLAEVPVRDPQPLLAAQPVPDRWINQTAGHDGIRIGSRRARHKRHAPAGGQPPRLAMRSMGAGRLGWPFPPVASGLRARRRGANGAQAGRRHLAPESA